MFTDDIVGAKIRTDMLKNGIKPTQWENGFVPDEVDTVCSFLQELIEEKYGDIGNLVMVWELYDDWGFGGGADFYLFGNDNKLYELSIPLIEGDFGTFVNDLELILSNKKEPLPNNKIELEYYNTEYNAVMMK